MVSTSRHHATRLRTRLPPSHLTSVSATRDIHDAHASGNTEHIGWDVKAMNQE